MAILKTKINVLQVNHGDSIIIETYDKNRTKFTILIDGGPNKSFNTLVKELKKHSKLDLIILTHIDKDHIDGLIKYFKSSHGKKHTFGKLILNAPNLLRIGLGTQIAIDDGIKFEKLIENEYSNIHLISEVYSKKEQRLNLPEGIDIKILSPNKSALTEFKKQYPSVNIARNRDTQISNSRGQAKDFDLDFKTLIQDSSPRKKTIKNDCINASSIAFSIKTFDFHGLFLGDAHPKIVTEGLKRNYEKLPVKFDYVKISHHGSKYNTSNELLDCIECYNYIISTDGGLGSVMHPNRQVIAKVVSHSNMQKEKVNFYFNYPLKKIERKIGKLFSKEELELFDCHDKSYFVI